MGPYGQGAVTGISPERKSILGISFQGRNGLLDYAYALTVNTGVQEFEQNSLARQKQETHRILGLGRTLAKVFAYSDVGKMLTEANPTKHCLPMEVTKSAK